MKILHVFKTYFPDTQGGLEEAIRQIARSTHRYGVKNRILTLSPVRNPPVVDFPEASVLRSPRNLDIASTPISFSFYSDFKREASNSDIIHFHFPWPYGEMIFLLSGIRKPSLVTYHSDIVKQKFLKKIYNPFLKMFLKKVNVVVATSQQYADSSVDLKSFKEKCRIIPLSIDSKRFSKIDEKTLEEVKDKYGEDFFLFVGVLRYYKGLEFLIEAMKGLERKIIIIGKGPEEEKLKRKAKQLKLNNIILAGYLDDQYLPAFYKICRAFVFPSCERSEAFGVSLLEASYFSKPMITTELGTGTSFVNRHNETGIIVPPKNIIELRKALILLSNNKTLCEEYGKNARKRYEKLFNSDRVGQEYLKIYKELYDR